MMKKTVSRIDDIPGGQVCFAIFKNRSIDIPGDERSRTHPGHGYPASTEEVVSMEIFFTVEDFHKEIEWLLKQPYPEKFRAVRLNPASIETRFSVEFKE